jgi:hypothetical protein
MREKVDDLLNAVDTAITETLHYFACSIATTR